MADATTISKLADLTAGGWAEKGASKVAFGAVPAHRRYELRQARYLDLVPRVQPLAAARGSLRILDIGSGLGSAKRFFDHAAIRADWQSIEIDPRRAELCRRLGYRRVHDRIDLETNRLPFDDGSFDVVVASHILEHLEDDAGAVAEWYRLVAPGGLLLIGVPMHLGGVAALARWRYRRIGRRPFGHCQFYSLECLERLFDGYPVRNIRGFRLFSARKWLPLEDYHWFFRLSMGFGRRWPGLTQEVNAEIPRP